MHARDNALRRTSHDLALASWGRGPRPGDDASAATVNTPTDTRSAVIPPGLHARLTVLQAGADERAALAQHLALALANDGIGAAGGPAAVKGPGEFFDAAREAALRRIEEHERLRGELTAQLRRAREAQAATINRRDEAAARLRRMSAHLADCEALVERSTELRTAAAQGVRELEARRAEVESAHDKLSLVEEQRAAAAQMIDDASHQLRYLEAAELDEPSLRRELEVAGHELRAAENAGPPPASTSTTSAPSWSPASSHPSSTSSRCVWRSRPSTPRPRSASPTSSPASWPASGPRSTTS